MADTLATLIVKLVADTAEMITGTKQAAGAVEDFIGVTKKIAGALGIAFGGREILRAVGEAMKYGDALQALSDKTDISAESLQIMERMAKGANTTLDAFANSTLELSKRLASGDQSAAYAARQLGLNIDELIQMRPDEAFAEVAEAIGRVADEGDRAWLAQDLMGKTGREMLPLLTTGYKDVAAAAKDAAFVISNDNVQALAEAQKKYDEFFANLKNGWVTFVASGIEALDALVADQAEYGDEVYQMTDARVRRTKDIELTASEEITTKQVENIEVVSQAEQAALDKRDAAHRQYLNFVFEREIEHAEKLAAAKEAEDEKYRDHRNMIGELLMQEDLARMKAEEAAHAAHVATLMQQASLLLVGMGGPPPLASSGTVTFGADGSMQTGGGSQFVPNSPITVFDGAPAPMRHVSGFIPGSAFVGSSGSPNVNVNVSGIWDSRSQAELESAVSRGLTTAITSGRRVSS